MFSLLLASALLCLALIAFVFIHYAVARFLVIPWFVCAIIDRIAWPLGWQTYVRAIGGPGWHRGRFGADAIHFIRRDPSAKRVPRLKARRMPISFLVLLAPMTMIALSACTTTTPTGGDDTVSKVQAAAKVACSFLPTAETIVGIIKVNDPRLATASAIANAICNALDQSSPAGIMTLLTKAQPMVDGVVIRGERVGK